MEWSKLRLTPDTTMSSAGNLLIPLHVSYIQKLGEVSPWTTAVQKTHMRDQNQDDLMYHLTSHLRLNAVYWGLTALCIMKNKDVLDREELLGFVMSCWDEKAGK